MLLATLDELNINHRNKNIYRISQSGFCGVGIARASQRFHSSQYKALCQRSNPDVCWMLEKVRFRLGTRHRFLWWWSLSAETICQRVGRVLQQQTALNRDWMAGLAWGNSLLCVAAVQIIILAFSTLKHLMLPRPESFGSNPPSALLSTQHWAVTAVRAAKARELNRDLNDLMDFFWWFRLGSLPLSKSNPSCQYTK